MNSCMQIYIAGPMAQGWLDGVTNAAIAERAIWEKGHVPWSPYGSLFENVRFGEPGIAVPGSPGYEAMMDRCFRVIRMCGALLRIEGESSGADREIKFAEELGIPVYYSVDEIPEFIG